MQRRTALAAGILPSALPCWAVAQAPASDLDLLEQALRALHPGLHRYQSEAALATGFHRLRRAWDAADGPRDRFLALNAFLGTLRCGHTYTNFYNQRGDVKQSLVLGSPRLPLHFVWAGDAAVVSRVHASAAAQVPVGSRLQAIDGRSMAALREALRPLVRADGHNLAAQDALLAPTGADELETFDVLHPLVFGAREAFAVDLLTPAGQPRRVALRGLSHAERRAMRPEPETEPSDATPPWPLTLHDDGCAVLRMPGWAMYRTRWDWQAYLGRCFERLQAERVRGLVVDLRGNEGGLDCGDALLARLIDAPLDAGLTQRRVRYRQVPAELNPHLDTWDDGFRDWGDRIQPHSPGWFHFRDQPIDRIAPAGPRFRGRVAVLVDGSNHSATFRFVQLVQRHRLGTLVGSPTGGNQRGINGGAFFFLRLPGSGIEVDLPLIGTFAPEGTPDAGLRPDVPVAATAADWAAGRDPVLAAGRRAVRA